MIRSLLAFSFLLLTQLSVLGQATGEKPQTPVPPFEYRIDEVEIFNANDSVMLSGTLTVPKKGKGHPAVILLSGSGAQDRDSELMGHKSFWVLADYFTKQGIAVLRVDDRGAGKSEGDYNQTNMRGFTHDALAAFDFLKTQKEINPEKIGFLGHSLGGTVALMANEFKRDEVDFLVLIGTSGLRGDKLMLLQKAEIERSMGVDEMSIQQGQNAIAGAYAIMHDNPKLETDSIKVLVGNYFKSVYGSAIPDFQLNMLVEQLTYPWLRDFITTDPAMLFPAVSCPVLAVGGEKDLQVPPKQNLSALEKGITANGNKDVTTQEMPGLNHLMQECTTGLPQEYATIEQTFSPVAMELIAKWILEHTK